MRRNSEYDIAIPENLSKLSNSNAKGIIFRFLSKSIMYLFMYILMHGSTWMHAGCIHAYILELQLDNHNWEEFKRGLLEKYGLDDVGKTCPSGWKIQRTGRSQNRYRSVPTDWEGHICKYAEKSYMYKYDLGHILSLCWRVVVILV